MPAMPFEMPPTSALFPPAPLAAHYDASADEFACACGDEFADLAALKDHIAEAGRVVSLFPEEAK